ncbi:MAG: hypothetical protein CME36_18740 [unclassified Hahellaceae]|nr:hypothetical protein [Hahellaceae bacterium]|tara:strand:- start:10097 stop:11251 length:1155 start_codon:yes stop_codon:yes gene_type:complete
MNILVLTYEYPPLGGGGGKVALGLAEGLVANGHSVDVVTMGFKTQVGETVQNGVRVHRLKSLRAKPESCHIGEMVPHEASVLFYVLKLAKTRRFDIIHAHFIFPDAFTGSFLAKRLRIPLICTAHGSDVPGYNPDRFQFQHVLLKPVWHYTVRAIDLITSPSEHLRKLILKSRPSAKVTVIPNGYDPARFDPNTEKQPGIVVCTRMFQRKGVQYIIDAAVRIAKEDLKYRIPLHILGEGPYLQNLRDQAAGKDIDITFHGWVDNDSPELKAIYENNAIFAFTSDQENFPVNLLEALCAGNAIITTDSSGGKEVVGDCALLVPPQNPEAIATQLKRLIDDAGFRRQLGQDGRKRLEDNFSWKAVTQQFEDSMRPLIEANERKQQQ